MDDQTYQIIGAALGKLRDVETAQVLNYLKAGGHQRGCLSISEPEVCSISASSGPTTYQSKRDPQEEICVI